MASEQYLKPGEVAARLGVSASTLRRWSTAFAAHLSTQAGESTAADSGGHAHRRYSEADVAVLHNVKEALARGQSYEQATAQLEAATLQDAAETPARSIALAPIATPAVAFLSETLHTVADGQQLLLNSQQANRDLLNLALQDNFNLKEENAHLRERMMRLEQELSENRRRDEARREMLERRLERLEDAAQQANLPAEPTTRRRSGWLARLLGL